MTLPLGYRNRNPGNLRYEEKWNWPGVVGIDSKRFAVFASPEDGIAAWLRQLRRYQKRGLRTFAEIVPVYAPAVENNVQSYISALVKQTGIAPDKPLNLDDRAEAIKVCKAFIRHELGMPPPDWPDREWYDGATYIRAWEKAKPLTKSRTITGAAGAAASAAVVIADAVVEVATNQTDVIVGAGTAAGSLWPAWGTIIAAVVGLCCLGVVIYARLQRAKPDQPTEETDNAVDQ